MNSARCVSHLHSSRPGQHLDRPVSVPQRKHSGLPAFHCLTPTPAWCPVWTGGGGCLVWLRTWVQDKDSHCRTLFTREGQVAHHCQTTVTPPSRRVVNSEPKGWGFQRAEPGGSSTASHRQCGLHTCLGAGAGLPQPHGLCGAGWTSSMTALSPWASSCAFCVSSHSQHTTPQISVPFFPTSSVAWTSPPSKSALKAWAQALTSPFPTCALWAVLSLSYLCAGDWHTVGTRSVCQTRCCLRQRAHSINGGMNE